VKQRSAFLVFVPDDKSVPRELSRGLKAPYVSKNVGDAMHIYLRDAHPRVPEEEKLMAVGYWCAERIDGCRVLLFTAKDHLFAWFNARFKVKTLQKAWRDPTLRLQLKRGGIKSVGEGVGRPHLPTTAPGVDLEQGAW